MTEREKMERGMWYDANFDEELLELRTKCKDLCAEYNRLMPSQTERQAEILRQLLADAPDGSVITAPFWCDYGFHIHLGEQFYSNHNCVMLDAAEIRFGKYVFVGPNCGFYTSGHPMNIAQRNAGQEDAKPIAVGDNVWIGGGVSVLPGVTIGSNTVIGAGSVVNRDIPAGVLAAGNPCRVIRTLTEEELYGTEGKINAI